MQGAAIAGDLEKQGLQLSSTVRAEGAILTMQVRQLNLTLQPKLAILENPTIPDQFYKF
jgi:hypothetical protein